MAGSDRQIEHLLRRAGFGARPDELDDVRRDVDHAGGQRAGRLRRDSRRRRQPDRPARLRRHDDQRRRSRRSRTSTTRASAGCSAWCTRDRPLQEKMTLFWHNHFATGYNKIAGALGATEGARYLAAKASEDPGQVRGQIEMLRDNALGNFRTSCSRSRRTRRCSSGSTAGPTPRRSRRRTSAARSWSCSRSASATTPSRTSTPRRACSPAGTCSGRARAADGSQHYEFVYNAEPARDDRQDVQLCDLSATAARRFRRARRRRHAGRHRLHQRPRRAPEHGALPRDQAVPLLRQRVRRGQRHVRQPRRRRSTCRAAAT